jgi:uncharacterized membrane protein YkgB
MKKKLTFWWHFITDSSFRHYVYLHDAQKMNDELEQMMREKQQHESRLIYQAKELLK